ncbi:hypothetical protein PT285_10715 [Lactobacillus sp. ESL0791]|uniref:hypothetical protein n=1 Tax=Lactobacillus sp. ESL0791 TaxID=2983234 RepID=UPI0023F8E91A|nr:hypothetical protein [Lactobacillus sp. ESL0791]MDF7639873.1 hypothetical protein [Lactobacillus sp. ESL0791]
MKFKKVLAGAITGLSLIAGTGVAASIASQPVEAAAVTHTVPKQFRGKWYSKGYGQYYMMQYTKNTYAEFTDHTKKNIIAGMREPVSVKKTGKNKCIIWTKSDLYKPHLTISNIKYNGRTYKMLSFKRGKNPALYYFNHKINRFYSARRGFIK